MSKPVYAGAIYPRLNGDPGQSIIYRRRRHLKDGRLSLVRYQEGQGLRRIPLHVCRGLALQLPVAGTSVFLTCVTITCSAIDFAYTTKSKEEYDNIDLVIMLIENVRHRDDGVWLQLLSNSRIRKYGAINSECVDATCLIQPTTYT